MTTIYQVGSSVYIENTAVLGATIFSNNNGGGIKTDIINFGATGIINYFPLYSNTVASTPQPTYLQMGGTTGINLAWTTSTSTSITTPFNLVSTGTLPIGTYILVGFFNISPSSGTGLIKLSKFGLFFDTAASTAINSLITGTPYHSSCKFMNNNDLATNYQINIATGNGIRLQTTMVINLTTPTIIYLNLYMALVSNTATIMTIGSVICITRIA